LGGLLFGYDTGVSNGAEGPMQTELGLTDLQLGIVISSLVFAAAVGALVGGKISDAIGRRTTIIVLAVMFFVGVLVVVFSPGFGLLVAGRIILGLAVGGASTVVPVYLAELAPFEIRGSITGRNELAIVVGQFAAFVVNYILFATLGHVEGVWRIMFGVCALPAVALFIGMLRMPESPRWLVEKGRYEEALAVLKTVRSEDRALAEFGQVETVAEEEKDAHINFAAIFSNRWLRRIVFVGIGVSVTQQLTGSRVLEESGFSETAATLANTLFGLAAVVGGIIALYNMDRIDRRKTFFIGLTLTTTCHCLVGIASLILPEGSPIRPYVILILITAFVLSMQTFLNIAVWVYLPQRRRLGVARGDLPAPDPRPGDRDRGVLRLVRQRAPRAVRPDAAGRVGDGDLLPVRGDRRDHARVPLARGARDPKPVARVARRGAVGRIDLPIAASTPPLRRSAV
ncbi:MAG: putative inositol transporter, partial [Thermomicrobiales bacterium]|nr:putative inositol transporter [Thermomicrobiales bacterium]